VEYTSHNSEETKKIASDTALDLVARNAGEPIVVALEGELGAGKTTFVQAFCTALGVAEGVKSPTFLLMKQYELSGVLNYTKLYHLDCYRLNNSTELRQIGIDEILKTSGNIVLIEWADRVAEILPTNNITVHMDHITEHERNIKIDVV